MNLQQFNALETGDKIINAMTNGEGTVTAVAELRHRQRIVKVKWGDGPGSVEFTYATHSTAWMHWTGPFCGVCSVLLESVAYAGCQRPGCKHRDDADLNENSA